VRCGPNKLERRIGNSQIASRSEMHRGAAIVLIPVFLRKASIPIGGRAAIDKVDVRMRMDVSNNGRQQLERRAMVRSFL